MATYSNVSGRLQCLGTDITSADILSNLNSLGIGSNHYGSTSGNKDVYVFNASIQIGNTGSTGSSSVWDCSDEMVKITGNDVRVYGTIVQGNISDGTSESGGAFAVTGAGQDDFRVYENGIFRCYGSMVYANARIRVDNDSEFTIVDCDAELEDGVSPGEGSSAYGARQALDYTRSRVHNTGAVGIKLYSFNSGANAAAFTLDGVKVEDCQFAFQLGNSANLSPVLKDPQIDSCVNHIVPNLGNADVTFINPDFTNLRAALSNSSDFTRIAFRYSLNVTDASLTPVSGVKVIIVDGDDDEQVNELTNASGQLAGLPTFDSETVLFNATYNGTSRTDRATTVRSIAGYTFNPREDTFTIDADFTDNVALVSDTSIAESNKTTVDAYMEIDTAAKFYDRAKSYFVDNYTGGVTLLATREGQTIDAGSNNVVVDASAGSAFSVSGSTITINASTFTGAITTTGTVTLSNGATVSGTINDSSGTSVAFSITVKDADDSSNINNAGVYVFARSGGALSVGAQIINNRTNASGFYTQRLTLTPDQPCSVRVRRSSSSDGVLYKSSIVQSTITDQGLSLEVSLDKDE